ncbi:hypothetical protein FQN54_006421 [Arachnomyces sp. PD_36]|nr:hypothetical protein FQN54_006421 [Arachnomyces sp. PD_36]
MDAINWTRDGLSLNPWASLRAIIPLVFIDMAFLAYDAGSKPQSHPRTTQTLRYGMAFSGTSIFDSDQTGHVFRVSPNELSFASADSWKAIYGAPNGNRTHLIKGEFYDIYGAGFKTGCIGSERNPKVHAQKKKNLTPAFSTKALQAQEPIIQRCIDEFVGKLGPKSKESSKGGLDVVEWYEMIAFDVLGEMAFGESFGCIKREENHFWIKLILDHLLEITLVDNLRLRNRHSGYSRAKVEERLNSTASREDFFTNLAGKVKGGEIDKEEMTAHASTLIIAGGETVATCLAAATYYLLNTPDAFDQLRQEIRSHYHSYEEIDASSALQLTYLQAVLNEALRIHPPGSQGFPRVSPGTEIDGYYVPAGTEDPEAFRPERWTDPNCTDRKDASQPFSLGLRACVGRNFAYTEMSLIMAKVIYKYDLELVEKDLNWEDKSHCHVMWWKAPFHVKFHTRP